MPITWDENRIRTLENSVHALASFVIELTDILHGPDTVAADFKLDTLRERAKGLRVEVFTCR